MDLLRPSSWHHGGMLWVTLVIVVVVVVVVLVSGHLTFAWAERRGWVYYRATDRPRPRSLGLFEEIYQPSFSHVVEQQVTQETEADQIESGEEV